MKKLLMTALVTGILFFMPAAEAEIETYIGVGNATMNETENQEQVINRAKGYAIRHASEQAGVYVVSQSKMRDLELVEDEVISITGGLMKIKDTRVEKSLLGGEVLQVRVTVEVQIDSEALQREIDRILDKRKPKREEPKPPVDKPKPIEPPKPKPEPITEPEPVAEPKPPVKEPEPVVEPKPPVKEPEPVVEPKPPVKEPIEKIEPPVPIEPVTPPTDITPSGTWITDEQIMTSELLELINAEREKAGKKPLTRNSVLVKGAKVRAEELARQWSHKRPNGQNWSTVLPVAFQQKSSWEYIHSKYDTAQKVVDWYMSQKDNKILNPNYQNIGIGYFYKADSDEKHFWVVILS